ncbi:MAG: helix-turn-helix domain-containing protein, partial [Acidobacteriota bacterium]
LINHFINTFNIKLNCNIKGISDEAAILLCNYNWPGNVRELRNCIERMMILEESDLLTTKYLPKALHPPKRENLSKDGQQHYLPIDELFRLPPKGIDLKQIGFDLVKQAIKRSNGNQVHAAKLLGISRDQLRYRLKKIEDQSRQHSL